MSGGKTSPAPPHGSPRPLSVPALNISDLLTQASHENLAANSSNDANQAHVRSGTRLTTYQLELAKLVAKSRGTAYEATLRKFMEQKMQEEQRGASAFNAFTPTAFVIVLLSKQAKKNTKTFVAFLPVPLSHPPFLPHPPTSSPLYSSRIASRRVAKRQSLPLPSPLPLSLSLKHDGRQPPLHLGVVSPRGQVFQLAQYLRIQQRKRIAMMINSQHLTIPVGGRVAHS